MKITTILKRFVPVLMVQFLALSVWAQPPDPGGDPGGNPPGAVPVDGGLAFLLGAGVVYGAKKGYDYRKKQREQQQGS